MRLPLWMVVLLVTPLTGQTPALGTWPRQRPMVFVDLAYPPDALAARANGAVLVRVTTEPSGRVVSAALLGGSKELAPAALANARQWSLSPGARTEVIVYRFEIDSAPCNDDTRSLFRLRQPNLAEITTCTRPGRAWVPAPSDQLEVVSTGQQPVYPSIAFSARLTGVVVLDITVDANGMVLNSRPLTDLPLLTEAAVAHSKTWRVRPTERRHGFIVYEFSQDRQQCSLDGAPDFWRVTADFWRLSVCSPRIP